MDVESAWRVLSPVSTRDASKKTTTHPPLSQRAFFVDRVAFLHLAPAFFVDEVGVRETPEMG